MAYDFVKSDTAPVYSAKTGGSTLLHLMWGDRVRVLESGSGRTKVKARGRTGWVSNSNLGGQSLLEFYFIDVGQGDGILIKTPSFRHVLIDGGFPRAQQDTGKNAADFVDWKFAKDYEKSQILIDAMITSHCDADHYGGLSDLLDVKQIDELDAKDVRVEAFYHAGLSWWKSGSGKTLGDSAATANGQFWTRLLEDRASAMNALGAGAGNKLHGWWADLFERVVATKNSAGAPTPIKRLSHVDEYVPGFEPVGMGGQAGEPSIKVLGPVQFDVSGKPALRKFTSNESQNTNGVSLLLRVDYGNTRVLLTGDLNKASQATLLKDYEGELLEFQCDVAKACHHGSEDVSYSFLQAMYPSATIISSGDNEGHDHPRPGIIAASATTGRLVVENDQIVTPLIYSTELGRSVDLGFPKQFDVKDANNAVTQSIKGAELDRSELHLTKTKKSKVRLDRTMVVGGLIYGLVNVRTDGKRIYCATLDEGSTKWRYKVFDSRF